MSYNVQLRVQPRTVRLSLLSHAPDGPLRLTFVRRYSTSNTFNRDDHGIVTIGNNTLNWTVTKTVQTRGTDNDYYCIFDFTVTHTPGAAEDLDFGNLGIVDWFVSGYDTSNYAILGNYAFVFNNNIKSNLTSSSYWARRKALPYPTYG